MQGFMSHILCPPLFHQPSPYRSGWGQVSTRDASTGAPRMCRNMAKTLLKGRPGRDCSCDVQVGSILGACNKEPNTDTLVQPPTHAHTHRHHTRIHTPHTTHNTHNTHSTQQHATTRNTQHTQHNNNFIGSMLEDREVNGKRKSTARTHGTMVTLAQCAEFQSGTLPTSAGTERG